MNVMKTINIAIIDCEIANTRTPAIKSQRRKVVIMIKLMLLFVFWGLSKFNDNCWVFQKEKPVIIPITTQIKGLSAIKK
jgi:hypothetical protein